MIVGVSRATVLTSMSHCKLHQVHSLGTAQCNKTRQPDFKAHSTFEYLHVHQLKRTFTLAPGIAFRQTASWPPAVLARSHSRLVARPAGGWSWP